MIRKLLMFMSNAGVESENKKEEQKKSKNNSRSFVIDKNVTTEGMAEIVRKINETIEEDDFAEESNPNFARNPIKLTIESYGGNIYDGLHLVNIMETSKTPFHTYSYGKCMSMGLAIFSAGHVRFAPAKATFMYHDGGTTVQGTYQTVIRAVEQGRKLTDMLDEIIVSTTTITQEKLDEVKERCQDWYFSGEEAYAFGLVDKLLPSTRHIHRQV